MEARLLLGNIVFRIIEELVITFGTSYSWDLVQSYVLRWQLLLVPIYFPYRAKGRTENQTGLNYILLKYEIIE